MRRHALLSIFLLLTWLSSLIACTALSAPRAAKTSTAGASAQTDEPKVVFLPEDMKPIETPGGDQILTPPPPETGAPDATSAPEGTSAPEPTSAPEATPAPQSTPPAEPAPAAIPADPHIALLLPLNSKTFARPAAAVRDGFLAAAQHHPGDENLPVKQYAVENVDALIEAYTRATLEGARVVVGPLTRDGVSALAKSQSIVVPTLALQMPDNVTELPGQLYVFSLSLEAEARQVAQLAYRDGKCSAVIVYADNALARRMQQAFADEWRKTQCTLVGEYRFKADPGALAAMKSALAEQSVDALFVAGDSQVVRQVRAYFKLSTVVYATSQVFRGKLDAGLRRELKGVEFVEMPWLLQPDHPAVAVYPQPKKALGTDLQRFYALGIDAFRLAQILLRSDDPARETLDGVTGRIQLGRDAVFVREPVAAIYLETGVAAPLIDTP